MEAYGQTTEATALATRELCNALLVPMRVHTYETCPSEDGRRSPARSSDASQQRQVAAELVSSRFVGESEVTNTPTTPRSRVAGTDRNSEK